MNDTAKVFLHPLWVRMWHWTNATLFLLLIITGFGMHFGGLGLPFRASVIVHNACGGLLTISFLAYVIGLFASGEWRQYFRIRPDMVRVTIRQAIYYSFGIFRGDPHPETPTREQKFNALQQLTYLGIVFFALPAIIISGGMLLNPQNAPAQIASGGGVWPVAVLHTVLGYALVAFTIGHIYLTTLGPTPLSYIVGMFTGWVEEEHHETAGEDQKEKQP